MRIGIDLGGTKIAAVVLGDDDVARWERRVPTPREDYDGTIAAIARLVEDAERDVHAKCTVGIGIPGSVSAATDRIKNANSTWLNGRPFHADLEARLRRPARLANDANCLAASESADGAAAGASIVFAVILGTGAGGGLVVNGHLLAGANAISGDWGHNALPWPDDDERPGPACYCGRNGCIETFVSGTGVALDYARRGGELIAGEAIVERAGHGEALALTTLDAWERRLAKSLAMVMNIVDPDVIVLGGGLSRVMRMYENVPKMWTRWVFSDVVTTKLLPARHGDASGVRGAARLWKV